MPDQLQPVKDPYSDQNFRQITQHLANLIRRLASFEATENFLKLVTPASRKVNYGTVEVEWGVKSGTSSVKEVEHGLGVEPKAVVCTFFDNNEKALAWCATRNWTSTKFSVYAIYYLEIEKGSKGKISWVAIG